MLSKAITSSVTKESIENEEKMASPISLGEEEFIEQKDGYYVEKSKSEPAKSRVRSAKEHKLEENNIRRKPKMQKKKKEEE